MTRILSPGGSVEMSLKALEAGADSIYVGPLGWSRRWKNHELTDDEIALLQRQATDMEKTVSVCFNCHCGTDEVSRMLGKIEKYAGWGIRSFTLLDFGIMREVKRQFPDLIVRASIASTAVTMDDVAFLEELKVDSVVLQPECYTIDELTEIKRRFKIELEIITFGNRDFAHRGRCIMSSYVSQKLERSPDGREMYPGSPNKGGLCHRVCLSNWAVRENDQVVYQGCLPNDQYEIYDNVDDYLDLGMDWFKIQGRVYGGDHIAKVTALYRGIIDNYERTGGGEGFAAWKRENRPALQEVVSERVASRTHQTDNRLALDHRVAGV